MISRVTCEGVDPLRRHSRCVTTSLTLRHSSRERGDPKAKRVRTRTFARRLSIRQKPDTHEIATSRRRPHLEHLIRQNRNRFDLSLSRTKRICRSRAPQGPRCFSRFSANAWSKRPQVCSHDSRTAASGTSILQVISGCLHVRRYSRRRRHPTACRLYGGRDPIRSIRHWPKPEARAVNRDT